MEGGGGGLLVIIGLRSCIAVRTARFVFHKVSFHCRMFVHKLRVFPWPLPPPHLPFLALSLLPEMISFVVVFADAPAHTQFVVYNYYKYLPATGVFHWENSLSFAADVNVNGIRRNSFETFK